MIIDSHVHLKHGDAAATEYAPEAIVQVMDAAGIARSVVFAMSTTTRRSIEIAAEAVARFPERLIPYVYALPSYERPVLAELDEALGPLGFKGIKIHIGECRLTDYIIDPVLRLAAKHGVPCLVDFGGDHGAAHRARLPRDQADRRPPRPLPRHRRGAPRQLHRPGRGIRQCMARLLRRRPLLED